MHLPNKMSVGPDQVTNHFLKKYFFLLMCLLFMAPIRQGVFPVLWENSFIIPVFKSGDPKDMLITDVKSLIV